MGAQRITSNSKFYLALFKFIFLKTHRLYYFIDHHHTPHTDKMAAGFASMLPMAMTDFHAIDLPTYEINLPQ